MGLPALNIIFASAANKSVKRSQRGVVGMIIKEATTSVRTNPVVIYKESDIPTELNTDSKEQISLALKGNVNAPSKIVVYVLGSGDADYKKALAYFELKKVNWLCCPTIKTDKQEQNVNAPSKIVVYVLGSGDADYKKALAYFELKKVNWLCCPTIKTDKQEQAVATWVKEQRGKRNKVKAVLPNQEADSEGVVNYATDSATIGEKKYTADKFTWVKEQRGKRNKVKAVLPNQEADSEGVVNYATDSATIGEKKYTADKFCSRIVGLIAGTPTAQQSEKRNIRRTSFVPELSV